MHWRFAVLTSVFAISMSWGETISITGTVKDGASKAALSDAIVRLAVNGLADTTDAAGAFTLAGSTAIAGHAAAPRPAFSMPALVSGGVRLVLAEPGRVVVTGHLLDGRQGLRIERTLPAGEHVIGCGAAARGVVLYRVRAGGRECVLRQAQTVGGATARTVAEVSGGRQAPLVKQGAAFADTLVVSKAGYTVKRVAVSSPTAADMVVELTATGGPKTYAIVDVATGGVTYAAELPDLETNAAYKTTMLVMKRIPAGSFKMGDEVGGHSSFELPVHTVTITKDMYLGVFEVTQRQWVLVVGGNPSSNPGDKKPVDNVTWDNIASAGGFTAKLNSRSSLTFRLPTEAEWERCCKAGTSTNYSYGNDPDGAWMWYNGNAGNTSHEVGTTTKKPNPWGIYDMHGNVWEWCSDWYDQLYFTYTPLVDPQGPPSSPYGHKVLIGGSYYYDDDKARSTRQGSATPVHVSFCAGFRIAANVPAQ